MLASITPLGERSRGNHWWLTAAFFIVASTTAGAALGAVIAGVGAAVAAVTDLGAHERLAAAAAFAATAMLLDVQRFARLPTTRRQVNPYWLDRYRGWVYGVGFGAQLGVGVGTIVTTAGVYALLAIAFVQQGPLFGALVVGVFGLVRGASLLPARGVYESAGLRSMSMALDRSEQRVKALVVAAYGSTAGFAIVVQQIGEQ